MGSGVTTLKESRLPTEDLLSAKDILKDYEYFIPATALSLGEVIEAEHSWGAILNNECPLFFEKKEANEIDFPDCLNWFYATFYQVYCEVNEITMADLEDRKKVQINQISNMITSLLKMFRDGNIDGVSAAMWKVASSHYILGVQAYQYTVVCKVLILSMEKCLGELWNEETLKAWSKITSVMLDSLLMATLSGPFPTPTLIGNKSRNSSSRSLMLDEPL